MGRKVVSGMVVVGLLGVTTGAARAAEGRDEVRAELHHLVSQGFPGGVGYLRDGRHEWHITDGVANAATGEPARAEHRFRIASNTKSFVATVVLQLAGERGLSLDDTVERWLPGTVRGNGNDGSKVSVRQLLNHTSGIHDPKNPHFFDPYLVDNDRGYVYTTAEVIRQSLLDPPSFAPGEDVEYSNTGYLLLGMIIERVIGHDVASEIRHRLLGPLGLRRTTFPITDPYLHGPHLHGYDLAGHDLTTFSPSYDWTAGAMVSTVDDLARFHRALLAGELLEPEQQKELRQIVPTGGPVGYGLGVETFQLPCPGGTQTGWGNTGAGPGYYSVSMSSEDGSRQIALVLTTYDLAAELRQQPPAPASPVVAVTKALCR